MVIINVQTVVFMLHLHLFRSLWPRRQSHNGKRKQTKQKGTLTFQNWINTEHKQKHEKGIIWYWFPSLFFSLSFENAAKVHKTIQWIVRMTYCSMYYIKLSSRFFRLFVHRIFRKHLLHTSVNNGIIRLDIGPLKGFKNRSDCMCIPLLHFCGMQIKQTLEWTKKNWNISI